MLETDTQTPCIFGQLAQFDDRLHQLNSLFARNDFIYTYIVISLICNFESPLLGACMIQQSSKQYKWLHYLNKEETLIEVSEVSFHRICTETISDAQKCMPVHLPTLSLLPILYSRGRSLWWPIRSLGRERRRRAFLSTSAKVLCEILVLVEGPLA